MLGYLDTSALMRWVERDVPQPRDVDVRVGAALDALIATGTRLAVSEITLVEFRSAVTRNWRRTDQQMTACDAGWVARARAALMEHIADTRIGVIAVPPHAFEHAMTLVDMAARDHELKLGAWDAIHLITACAWAHKERATVGLYTTDDDFERFTVEYPHFLRFAVIVNLEVTTQP
jgi:predicted nucleic acid-binding protein